MSLFYIIVFVILAGIVAAISFGQKRSRSLVYGMTAPDNFNLGAIKKRGKAVNFIFFAILMFFLLFLTMFRAENIGRDTSSYIDIYNDIAKNGIYANRYEIGYRIFNYLVSIFLQTPRALLIIAALFCYIPIIIIIGVDSDNLLFSAALFFFLMYAFTTHILREAMASVMVLIAVRELLKNKYPLFILFVALAVSFHISAVIVLTLLIFKKLRFSIPRAVFLVVFALLFFKSGLWEHIFPWYGYYTDGQYAGTGYLAITLQLLVMLFMAGIGFYCIWQKLKRKPYGMLTRTLDRERNAAAKVIGGKDREKYDLFAWILVIPIIILVMGYTVNLVDRLLQYPKIIFIILFPNILHMCKSKAKRIYLLFLILGILFAYTTIVYYFRPEWSQVFPYRFFWSS